MKHTTINSPIDSFDGEAIAVGVYSDSGLTAAAQQIDSATDGALQRLVSSGMITGKPNEVTPLLGLSAAPAEQIVVIGLGPRDQCSPRTSLRAAGAATKYLTTSPRKSVACLLDDQWSPQFQEHAIVGAMLGCVGQGLYQAKPALHPIEHLQWPSTYQGALDHGEKIGTAVNFARRLVNEPPSELYPESFADQIVAMSKARKIEVEIWDEEKLAAERCGALLAVARGSAKPARLAIMRYQGGGANKPIALVGKGVTFDAGGLSIKPSEGMKTMKCDMAGAATVVAAMQAVADLELPVNVIGIVGLVENMLGAAAYKLGDVLTARNGTTIEVLNTDAEGRLVLADALSVAVDLGAENIVDLATLTGACVVALGEDITGVMTNDDAWCNSVINAAKTADEDVWQLPMHRHFDEQIHSKVADIKNIGAGRWGGATTAAKLLERFVDSRPWVHLDIAGPSFRDKPTAWIDAGGSGVMVQTLVELCRSIPPDGDRSPS